MLKELRNCKKSQVNVRTKNQSCSLEGAISGGSKLRKQRLDGLYML